MQNDSAQPHVVHRNPKILPTSRRRNVPVRTGCRISQFSRRLARHTHTHNVQRWAPSSELITAQPYLSKLIYKDSCYRNTKHLNLIAVRLSARNNDRFQSNFEQRIYAAFRPATGVLLIYCMSCSALPITSTDLAGASHKILPLHERWQSPLWREALFRRL